MGESGEGLWPPAAKEKLKNEIEGDKAELLEVAKNVSEVADDEDYLAKGLVIFEEKARKLFAKRQELKKSEGSESKKE